MYKYGITYHTIENGARVPDTGREVRLVRPGKAWADGIPLIETGSSGYYEIMTESDAQVGFYQIWDDRSNPPSFSGKTCFLGMMDGSGIKPQTISHAHLQDGVISNTKIGAGAIKREHFSDLALTLHKIAHEIQSEYQGEGDTTRSSPALFHHDKFAIHHLDAHYKRDPFIVLVNRSNGHVYLQNVYVEGGVARVEVGIGPPHDDSTNPSYLILALSLDTD